MYTPEQFILGNPLFMGFFASITQTFETLTTVLTDSSYVAWLGPLVVFLLAFVETVGIIGFLLPLNIVVIGILAAFTSNIMVFGLTLIALFVGEILGVWAGYWLGRGWGKPLYERYLSRAKVVRDTVDQIDEMITQHKHLSLPLIMISHVRSIIGMYWGSQNHKLSEMIRPVIIGTAIYVVIQGVIGYLVGRFGAQIIKNSPLQMHHIAIGIGVLIVVAVLGDIRQRGKKE